MANSYKFQEKLSERIAKEYHLFLTMIRDFVPSFEANSLGKECEFEQNSRISLYRQAIRTLAYIDLWKENFEVSDYMRKIDNSLQKYFNEEDSKIVGSLGFYENIRRISVQSETKDPNKQRMLMNGLEKISKNSVKNHIESDDEFFSSRAGKLFLTTVVWVPIILISLLAYNSCSMDSSEPTKNKVRRSEKPSDTLDNVLKD